MVSGSGVVEVAYRRCNRVYQRPACSSSAGPAASLLECEWVGWLAERERSLAFVRDGGGGGRGGHARGGGRALRISSNLPPRDKVL
eukprot:COSAG01_NODE_770_length_13726_cov_66.211639_9_plen_86_part_00